MLKSKGLYLSFVLFIWAYLILRAIYNPFVFDEATSFLLYAKDGDFLPWLSYWSANNHFVNSFLMYLSSLIIGNEEWMLRLPNLMAFPLFAFFLFKISSFLNSKYLRWALFLSVFSVHIFIEMFAYARGYGLSFAFLAAAIYYALSSLQSNQKRSYYLFFLFQALMLFSNLSLLPIALLFSAFVWLGAVWKGYSPVELGRGILAVFIYGGLSIGILFELKEHNRLYYGSDLGFLNGSIASLFDATIGSHELWTYIWLSALMLFLTFGLIILIKKGSFLNNRAISFFISGLLIVPIFYLFGNWIIDLNFPLERSLLYLPMILILALLFVWDSIQGKDVMKVILFILIISPFSLHFAKTANLHNATSFLWNREQIPDSFYDMVQNDSNDQVTISGYFLRKICWEYLNFKSEEKLNTLQIQDYPSLVSDYRIVDLDSIHDQSQLYDTLIHDDGSNLTLMRRKEFLKRTEVFSEKVESSKNKAAFVNFSRLLGDQIPQKPIYIEYSLKMIADKFSGLLAYSLKDSLGNSLGFDEVRLTNMYEAIDIKFQSGLYIASIPNNCVELDIYLWNINNAEYQIESGTIKVFELNE